MRRALSLVPIAALALLVACSSDDDSSGDPTASGCAADNRKDIYTQGMTRPASDLEISIVDSAFTPSNKPPTPGAVQKGMNTMTVEVLDAAKNPVDGATVNLTLMMPDHGHGSAAVPVITPQGGGKYRITNIWLSMSGLWRFTIGVTQNGAVKTTDFNFCVDG